MKPKNLAIKIRQLVSKHETLRALNLAQLNAPSEALQDEIVLLLQRWRRLMNEKRLGVITQETADLNANRIAQSLLSIASEINNWAEENKKETKDDAIIINTFALLAPILLSSILYFFSSTTYFNLNEPVELSKAFFSSTNKTKSHYLLIRKNPELFSPQTNPQSYEAQTHIRPGQRDTFKFIQVDIQPIRNRIDVNSTSPDNTESIRVKSFQDDKSGVFKFLINYRCKKTEVCRPLRKENEDIFSTVVKGGSDPQKVRPTNAFDYIYIWPVGTLLPFSILLYILLFFKKRITLELYVLWYRLNTRH